MGVDPAYQHRGTGSQLLTNLLAHAPKNVPGVLETSALQNLPWYERFHFDI
ncbi:GNAT family N-acetyltransferase [Mucilaginibacter sp. 3215]|uniref:GNAT family N-acetyltransferase n=1 Tax=Mucilaginibacter sp. 3215 TaxID=3373912 RepID=UPI003D252806